MEAQLAEAQAAFDADPTLEANIIWLGRRLSYLGRIHEAIDVYTRGLDTHPRSPRILRHRGHRFITIRNFTAAYDDLLNAAMILEEDDIPDEIEPDGQPNARNQPTSTLHGNISYHLALAAYLKGDFAQAAAIWDGGIKSITMSDDMRIAFAYWRFNAQVQLDTLVSARSELDAIADDLTIIENHAYYNLLLRAKGVKAEPDLWHDVDPGSVDEVTIAYGLAIQALAAHDLRRMRSLLTRAINSGQWPAFGAIAAEVDLVRLNRAQRADPRSFEEHTQEQIRDITRQRRQ